MGRALRAPQCVASSLRLSLVLAASASGLRVLFPCDQSNQKSESQTYIKLEQKAKPLAIAGGL